MLPEAEACGGAAVGRRTKVSALLMHGETEHASQAKRGVRSAISSTRRSAPVDLERETADWGKQAIERTELPFRHDHRSPLVRASPSLPMTLGNMRALGVRSLAVTCELCHHEALLAADEWPGAVLVRAFRPRMVCTRCGIVGADARPNWREFTAQGK